MIKFGKRASGLLYNFLASNVDQKSKFILPANVCPVVPLTLIKVGITFEFVDIDDSMHVNFDRCLDTISKGNFTGMIFVNPYGNLVDTSDFFKEIKTINNGFLIVDDRCLCVPSMNDTLNDYTDLILYSTGYSKYVDIDYGGWCVMGENRPYRIEELHFDESQHEKLQNEIRMSFSKNKQLSKTDYDWLNSELISDINDYVDSVRNNLVEINRHKRLINNIYYEIIPPEFLIGEKYNDWRFMLNIQNRDMVLSKIFQANLFAGKNFPDVTHLFENYNNPIAYEYGHRLLNLFNDFRIQEDQAIKLAGLVRDYAQI